MQRNPILGACVLLAAALAGCAETDEGGIKETADRDTGEEINGTEPYIPPDDRQPTSPYDPFDGGLNDEVPPPDGNDTLEEEEEEP